MLVAARAVVNLYGQASLEVEVTSQVIYGWEVEPLEIQGGWVLVRTHDSYTGWARLEMFAEATAPEGMVTMRIEGVTANVYAEPDVKRRAARLQVPWEARMWVRDEAREQTWAEVWLVDGRPGFLHRADMGVAGEPLSVEAMLEVGKRFLGVTYTWGGVSSFGYDCSGFVQMLLRQRGIAIPRDAQTQAGWDGFEEIEVGEVEQGDVVFFGESEQRITHVGIAAGGGKFLHSTTEGRPGVKVNRLAEMPWRERMRGARRVREARPVRR